MAQASLTKGRRARIEAHAPRPVKDTSSVVAAIEKALEPTINHPAATGKKRKVRRGAKRTRILSNTVEQRTRALSNVNNAQTPVSCAVSGEYYIDPVCLAPVSVGHGFRMPLKSTSNVTTSLNAQKYHEQLIKFSASAPIFCSPISAICAIRSNKSLTDAEKKALIENTWSYYTLDQDRYTTERRLSIAYLALDDNDIAKLREALAPTQRDMAVIHGHVDFHKLEARKGSKRAKRAKLDSMETEGESADAPDAPASDTDNVGESDSESSASDDDASDDDATATTPPVVSASSPPTAPKASTDAAFNKADAVVASSSRRR